MVVSVVLVLGLAGAGPVLAAPLWRLSSRAAPSNLPPGATGLIVATADDIGDTGIKGSTTPVTITDALPAGLAVSGGLAGIRARRFDQVAGEIAEEANWSCTLAGLREVRCATKLDLPAYEGVELLIPVEVAEPKGTVVSLANEVSVAGGEGEEAGGGVLASASLTRPVRVSEAPVSFGVEEDGYSLAAENEDGTLDHQAGSHPFQLTTTLNFNQTLEAVPVEEGKPAVRGLQPASPSLAKDLEFALPPGLLGNITAVEQCPEIDFATLGQGNINFCPAGSAIGVATVSINIPKPYGYWNVAVPLFNLAPTPGEPARFGFEINKVSVELDTSLRSGGDYGVTAKVANAPETGQILASQVSIWGDPDNQAHDPARGWACLLAGVYVNHEQPCEPPNPRTSIPLLTLPTACTGTLNTLLEGNSWTGQQLTSGYVPFAGLGEPLQGLEGCQALPFSPSIAAEPAQPPEEGRPPEHTTAASTPTGLNVKVNVAQQGTLSEGQLADADVKSTTVTLPEGMELNPSAANGLQACSQAQIGYLAGGGEDPLAPGAPEPLRFSTEPAHCPDASKIGIVHIKTPLLNQELEGAVYLATPAPNGQAGRNPFNSLLALYIVAENPTLGLRVKLAGETKLNHETGQLTTTFLNTPQVPFEELKLELFGGSRAAVATPAPCGSYRSEATFSPWSGTPPVQAQTEPGEFQITSGTDGAPCAGPLSFEPSFQAGSTSLQAGAFTSFTLGIEKPDGQQALTGVSVTLPPGVAALLSSITPCPEPQASRGECGPESEIGQATASAGLGPDPVTETGRAYITGPYQSAPFGLAIATPAVAGPFNLGTIVVRSAINVNPTTAQVTITSSLPTLVQGIGMPPTGVPLALKQVTVNIDRPGFQFNPTSCDPMSIQATLTGAEGASASVSSPFQVSGCQNLPFQPQLTASVAGHASKADGTTFNVTVRSPGVGQANIAKVDLQLPLALPSRLSTIQQACTAPTFEANPASCDEGSVIGYATIHTPVLKNPVSGPAYLVSHGGAAFPDVEFVLQGEGITLILDGKTDIKNGITYSRFESAPDAPFTVFETVLPAGPHSALTANVPEKDDHSLCGQTLKMPTVITAQNGTVIEADTPIATTGCSGVLSTKTKLTHAQLLAKALKACRSKYKHARSKRLACEKYARRRYTAKKSTRTTTRASHHRPEKGARKQ